MTDLKRTVMLILVAGLVALAPAPAPAAAETRPFEAQLRAALELHDQAASLEEQAQALTAFQETAAAHPGRWLGHFWTAYEETQIARLRQRAGEDADLNAYLDRAQNHLAKIEQLQPDTTDRERSSIAQLQGLLYHFRAVYNPAEAGEWRARSDEAIERGIALDGDNPVVLVMVGTDLIRRGRQEKDPGLVLAGIHLLRRAQGEGEKVSDRSRTTLFNLDWIQFWLPGAEKALSQLLGSS